MNKIIDFEELLEQMNNNKINKRQDYFNSVQHKIDTIIIDFKCWCFANNKFYNLNKDDFSKYKKSLNIKIDFNIEMRIYEDYFGYEFQFDDEKKKWKTIKVGNEVLNKEFEDDDIDK